MRASQIAAEGHEGLWPPDASRPIDRCSATWVANPGLARIRATTSSVTLSTSKDPVYSTWTICGARPLGGVLLPFRVSSEPARPGWWRSFTAPRTWRRASRLKRASCSTLVRLEYLRCDACQVDRLSRHPTKPDRTALRVDGPDREWGSSAGEPPSDRGRFYSPSSSRFRGLPVGVQIR
jgi:hypothetical protein